MAKKNLYIIGAGELGREIGSWLTLIPELERDYQVIGYLDNNKDALQGYNSPFQVLGSEIDYAFPENSWVIIAISDVHIREKVFNNLKSKVKFYPFIHPTAVIGLNVEIGEGCLISPYVVITTNIVIGRSVFINIGSVIGHDCSIGNFCSLMPHTDLGGHVKLGDLVTMGTKTTIAPHQKIGTEAYIGSGSVILRNIPNGAKAVGNPAKIIG
ncbi:MAG: acetyltransferase [Saprospiraceae bacterium]|nr:acetyltransferase [Saprospiraceae bacterium]